MSVEQITSVHLLWDVRYKENSEIKFRIEQDFSFFTLQDSSKIETLVQLRSMRMG